MAIIDYVTLGLLGIITAETSYLVYQSYSGERKINNNDIFVDTSVLMDGRILPVAEAGFIPGRLVIPRSVIGEMQLLADTGDSDKREKARRGLDVLSQLQKLDDIDVMVLQDGSRANEGVDERLLAHAKSSGGSLATIDFNLNKVAVVENIRVLNINELAKNLRMSYLPGERLMIDLTTAGTDSHQAVGHLGDGTMVVVEHAKKSIGKSVEIEVIRSLQTAAGRMMFARLARLEQVQKAPQQHQQQQQQPPVDKSQRPRTPDKPAAVAASTPLAMEVPRRNFKAPNEPKKTGQSQQQRQASHRRTSNQREASFIELIDQQK